MAAVYDAPGTQNSVKVAISTKIFKIESYRTLEPLEDRRHFKWENEPTDFTSALSQSGPH